MAGERQELEMQEGGTTGAAKASTGLGAACRLRMACKGRRASSRHAWSVHRCAPSG